MMHSFLYRFLIIVLLAFVLPENANAAELCENIAKPSSGIAKGIVDCVKGQFKDQTNALIDALTEFMTDSSGSTGLSIWDGMVTLAILFFGIRVMGKGAGWGEALGFLTRIAVVGAFWSNMDVFYEDFFAIPDELIAWTSGTTDPWSTIDSFMGKMLGYGGQLTLVSGVIGVLAGAMFSSALGFTLFIFGIKAILDLIFMVVQVIFIYLTAFMVIAFMFAISPIIVPLAVFGYTEQYVRSWLGVVVSSMLTPMFLMMCLSIFLPLIPHYVDKIFEDMGVTSGTTAPDLSIFSSSHRPVASWLMSGDPNQAADMAAQTQDGIQPPAIPSHVNPNMRVSSDVNMMSISSINFGPNTVGIIRKLLQDFVALIVITYLLKSLIDQMPTIASEIGGSRVGIFSSAPSAAERQIKGMISGIEQKFSGGGK